MDRKQSRVLRILYKEIVPGDLRKFLAESNDTKSGGGARDLRFGAYTNLLPAIREMFPIVVTEERLRGSTTQSVDIFKGKFYWFDSKQQLKSEDAFFEPPTSARPLEARIRRVHEYECFNPELIPTASESNKVLLLLIQQGDGTVWPYFAEERTLRQPGVWDPDVAEELLGCIDARRRKGQSVIGFKDFTTMESYCNGN